MHPHRIRLRGPWQIIVTGLDGEVRIFPMPADWSHLSPVTRASFRRTFGRPKRLESHERAWLIVEHVAAQSTVLLNGGSIGAEQAGANWEQDVTEMLQDHNELRIDQETAGGGAIGWDEAALEIR